MASDDGSFGFDIKLESFVDEALDELENEKIEQMLYALGTQAVAGAVMEISGQGSTPAAVDTGRLRASISFVTHKGNSGDSRQRSSNSKADDKLTGKAPQDDSVIVGSNVEYASYVELGTNKMNARPFLQNGIQNSLDGSREICESIMRGDGDYI